MDQRCKALLGMLAVTWVLGPNVAMPTEAAELYAPRVHKARTRPSVELSPAPNYLRVRPRETQGWLPLCRNLLWELLRSDVHLCGVVRPPPAY